MRVFYAHGGVWNKLNHHTGTSNLSALFHDSRGCHVTAARGMQHREVLPGRTWPPTWPTLVTLYAACDMPYAKCRVPHAGCRMWQGECSVQCSACSATYAACRMQRASRRVLQAACDVHF
eukprot:21216-Chlamydomonas_euryale.AAC.2